MGENKEESLRRNLRESQIQKAIRAGAKGINSEVPAGKFQRRSELAPKGINYEALAKVKRNPKKEFPGIFIPKYDPSWLQK